MKALSAIKEDIKNLVGTPLSLKTDTKGRALLFVSGLPDTGVQVLENHGYHVQTVPGGLCIDPSPALWQRLFDPFRKEPKHEEALSLAHLLQMHQAPLALQDASVLKQGLINLYRTPTETFFQFVGKAIADSLRQGSPVPSHLGLLLEIGGF